MKQSLLIALAVLATAPVAKAAQDAEKVGRILTYVEGKLSK